MCLLLFCEKEIIQPKNSFLMKHFWSIFNKTKYFSNINPSYTGEEPGHEALLHAVHTTHTSSWHLRSSKWPAPRRAKWSLTFTWLYFLKSIRTKCKLINVVGYGCTSTMMHTWRLRSSFPRKGLPVTSCYIMNGVTVFVCTHSSRQEHRVQVHYRIPPCVASRASNSGPHTCIASALLMNIT